jgi:hypothetical protein
VTEHGPVRLAGRRPSGVSRRRLVVVALAGLPPLALAVAGITHPGSLTPATAGYWRDLHVALLPVFPLLGLAPWLLVRDRGAALRWVTGLLGYTFAAFYGALDVLAGIGAGAEESNRAGDLAIGTLFHQADLLARVGVRAYLAATVLAAATAIGAAKPARLRVVAGAGAVLTVSAAVSFQHSHIFWPRGVVTMLGLAAGWVCLAWALTAPADGRTA